LLPFAISVLEDGGTFITSGIISDRIEDVENALKQAGFTDYVVNRSGDWASMVCRKN